MKLIVNQKAEKTLEDLKFLIKFIDDYRSDWDEELGWLPSDCLAQLGQAADLLESLYSAGRDELLKKGETGQIAVAYKGDETGQISLTFKEANTVLHATLSYIEENPAHLEENPDELEVLEKTTRKLSELSGRLFPF